MKTPATKKAKTPATKKSPVAKTAATTPKEDRYNQDTNSPLPLLLGLPRQG